MPKRRYNFIREPSDSRFASSALLSVFFGLAAGAVGMLLALAYGDIPTSPPETPPSAAPSGARRTVVELPPVPERDLSRSAVRLFAADAERVERPYGTMRFAEDALGSGIVLTSDGWIITHERALERQGRRIAPRTAVVAGRSYEVVETAADPYSGIVFLKVDGSGLPVTPFGAEIALAPGDQLFGLDAAGGVRRLEVIDIGTPPEREASDIVRSSERIQRLPRLTSVQGMLPGSVLTDEKGDAVAVYGGDGSLGGEAVPIGTFLRQVSSVLRDGEVSRPRLGVRYVDLSRMLDVPEDGGSGALVAAPFDGRTAAVTPGGPAALAGVRAGDVVTTVGGERVSSSNPLPELVAEYAPGDRVALTLQRNGQPMSVEVTLDAVPVQ